MSKQIDCPVMSCNRKGDYGPYKGPLGDLVKHIAMSMDSAHYNWRKQRGIPECPLPNDPNWGRKSPQVLMHVKLALLEVLGTAKGK